MAVQPFTLSPDYATQVVNKLAFNKAELLPAIAVQYDSGEILMQAWMNREAVLETLTTGRVCYYSRSRQGLWRKGDTSGHRQYLMEMKIDCDYDSLLLMVHQEGPACHTNRRHCYFHQVTEEGELKVTAMPMA